MAQATVTEVVVFTDKLYRGNGDVIKWCRKITNRFGFEVKRAVPVREGTLWEGIHWSTRRTGRKQVAGTLVSEAKHTLYVLRGTTGPISTNKFWANPGGAERLLWKNITTAGGKKVRKQIWVRQKGYYMPIPDIDTWVFAPLAGQGHWATEVEGQSAQNFLVKAWVRTSYDHRALRGRRIPTFIRKP